MHRLTLGTVSATPAAAAALKEAGLELESLLQRYQNGIWGEGEELKRGLNDFMVDHALPVFSCYTLTDGATVILITTADRSETHVVVPGEAEPAEVNTRDGYAAWSQTYDAELNQLIILEQERVDRLLLGLPHETVLDAATGTGRHALALARRGAIVSAFDISPEMLAVARARARAEGLSVHFVEASLLEPLPFPSDQFDLVLCSLAFCHLPEIDAPCREFSRVTRAGGHLLVTDFHPDALAFGMRTLIWHGHRRYILPNFPRTRADYIAAVEEAGFVVREVADIPLAELPAEASHPALLREIGSLNFCLVVHGEKRS